MITLPAQAATAPELATPEPSPLDTALNCCQAIEKLAGHLQQVSLPQYTELSYSLLVANSGYLIAREIEQLRRALRQLEERSARLAATQPSHGKSELGEAP